MSDPQDVFPEELGRRLHERDLSPVEFGGLIDVAPAVVVEWLNGTAFPCPRHMGRVMVVLNASRDDLLCPS